MFGRVFIDTFSSLDDLPKKLHGDEKSVFIALGLAGRVSTFEMTPKLWDTMKRLEKSGRIALPKSQYPWHDVTILEHSAQPKAGEA